MSLITTTTTTNPLSTPPPLEDDMGVERTTTNATATAAVAPPPPLPNTANVAVVARSRPRNHGRRTGDFIPTLFHYVNASEYADWTEDGAGISLQQSIKFVAQRDPVFADHFSSQAAFHKNLNKHYYKQPRRGVPVWRHYWNCSLRDEGQNAHWHLFPREPEPERNGTAAVATTAVTTTAAAVTTTTTPPRAAPLPQQQPQSQPPLLSSPRPLQSETTTTATMPHVTPLSSPQPHSHTPLTVPTTTTTTTAATFLPPTVSPPPPPLPMARTPPTATTPTTTTVMPTPPPPPHDLDHAMMNDSVELFEEHEMDMMEMPANDDDDDKIPCLMAEPAPAPLLEMPPTMERLPPLTTKEEDMPLHSGTTTIRDLDHAISQVMDDNVEFFGEHEMDMMEMAPDDHNPIPWMAESVPESELPAVALAMPISMIAEEEELPLHCNEDQDGDDELWSFTQEEMEEMTPGFQATSLGRPSLFGKMVARLSQCLSCLLFPWSLRRQRQNNNKKAAPKPNKSTRQPQQVEVGGLC